MSHAIQTEQDETSDPPPEAGPVIEWIESQGWTKDDVDVLVNLLTLVSLAILITRRAQEASE